jgi:hypothetical protein
VFTKTKPRTEGRYYAINKRKSIFGDDSIFAYSLEGFGGNFLAGVQEFLKKEYAAGHRYVRIEP